MDDHQREVEIIQQGAEFITGFAPAIIKLRNAALSFSGCQLDRNEVQAVMEAFRLLKRPVE